jgi:hypothetical protein
MAPARFGGIRAIADILLLFNGSTDTRKKPGHVLARRENQTGMSADAAEPAGRVSG